MANCSILGILCFVSSIKQYWMMIIHFSEFDLSISLFFFIHYLLFFDWKDDFSTGKTKSVKNHVTQSYNEIDGLIVWRRNKMKWNKIHPRWIRSSVVVSYALVTFVIWYIYFVIATRIHLFYNEKLSLFRLWTCTFAWIIALIIVESSRYLLALTVLKTYSHTHSICRGIPWV